MNNSTTAHLPLNKPTGIEEFLPGILEVQHKPPSPSGRIILWAVLILLLLAVIWAMIGKVDIVAMAQGRIITTERDKIIQPLETGTVLAIHIREGQKVHKGDVLIELDDTPMLSELRQTESALDLERTRVQRIRALLESIDNDVLKPTKPTESLQFQIFNQQLSAYKTKITAIDFEIMSKKSSLQAAISRKEKTEATLPILRRQSNHLKQLVSQKLHPEYDWLEKEQAHIAAEHELGIYQAQENEIRTAIKQLEQEKDNNIAEFHTSLLKELEKSEQKIRILEQQKSQNEYRIGRMKLTAPISGTIQQLAIHTEGGVVTPAQNLMTIVPEEENPEIEAWILNKDIGFVRKGQQAEIKIEAFPFTRYGVVDAIIEDISPDAIQDETLGLVYRARVRMNQNWISVDNTQVKLNPGMAVTVEVKTGKRRIIEYLLSPLLRYKQESLRER